MLAYDIFFQFRVSHENLHTYDVSCVKNICCVYKDSQIVFFKWHVAKGYNIIIFIINILIKIYKNTFYFTDNFDGSTFYFHKFGVLKICLLQQIKKNYKKSRS